MINIEAVVDKEIMENLMDYLYMADVVEGDKKEKP
jgi:hypothetical protein